MEFFWPLLVMRWLHLGSLLILFGASLFVFYDGRWPGDTTTYRRLASLALVTGCCWLVVSLADMVDGVAGLASSATWHTFFFETGFGRVWVVRLAGLLALSVYAFLAAPSKGKSLAICSLSAALLIGTAWLGHAAAAQGVEWFASSASYGCHVLGAGAWLGGLVPLSQCLWRDGEIANLRATLQRFSRMGMTVVVLIVASGMVNAYLRSVSLEALIATSYGNVLAVKLALFGLLIGVAATNRWVFLRRLRRNTEGPEALHALQRSVVLEQLLGAGIVAAAVALASMPPGE
jgi:putative copper resistance protein D